MAYRPKPIDTSGIQLPRKLLALTEELARNTHDVWAATRIAQGWTYGPKRNDAEKRHPCLVPYDQLPESEKEYDRNTAMETIKLALAMGCTISYDDGPVSRSSPRRTRGPVRKDSSTPRSSVATR